MRYLASISLRDFFKHWSQKLQGNAGQALPLPYSGVQKLSDKYHCKGLRMNDTSKLQQHHAARLGRLNLASPVTQLKLISLFDLHNMHSSILWHVLESEILLRLQ